MPSETLSLVLHALADPTRRALLARLAAGDATVKELARPFAMTVAAVSKHLKVLETAGLISRSRCAQARPCHFEGRPLQEATEWIEAFRRFWDGSLDALADHLKSVNEGPTRRNAHEAANEEGEGAGG
jgi:DNA-binding transcriptional ArsR family regulator